MRVTKLNQAPHFAAADVQPADVWCTFINGVVIVYEAVVCTHESKSRDFSCLFSSFGETDGSQASGAEKPADNKQDWRTGASLN